MRCSVRHPGRARVRLPAFALGCVIALACVTALCARPVMAQDALSLSGYAMTVASALWNSPAVARASGERGLVSNVSRLRLRPAWNPCEALTVAGEYEIASMLHTAPLLLSPASGGAGRQAVRLAWRPLEGGHGSLVHSVDRLYAAWRGGDAEIIAGRQRIAWGSGRVWNPTDLFNPLNPANIAKIEKDGVDAVTGKLQLGDFTDIAAVVNPRSHASVNAGMRFRTNAAEFDLAAVAGRFDDRALAGADVAGNFFTAGLRGEITASFPLRDDGPARDGPARVRAVAGIDYQFTAEWYALLEYHFNGDGAAETASYDVERLLRGELLNLGRQYLAAGATCLLHPLLTASGTVIANLGDGSSYQRLQLAWSLSDNAALALALQWFRGAAGTEYGLYPSGLNLTGDWYF